jgi:transcriptional regulator with XRE-family HTH domain
VERIKQVRKAAGVSLSALAERTGLFREQIAYAERAGTDPRASTLEKLARGLGVPVCAFFASTGGSHARHRQHRPRPRA